MRLTMYEVEVDENCIPFLVKKESKNCPEVTNLRMPYLIKRALDCAFRASYQAEEHVYLIGATASLKPTGVFEISHGCINRSFMGNREIFLRLILSGASSFFVAHNHPSSDCTPSSDDIESTQKLKAAADLMGINFLDHVILGHDNLYSFNENGAL